MISARINAATKMAPAYSRVLRLKTDFTSIAAVESDDDDSSELDSLADEIVS